MSASPFPSFPAGTRICVLWAQVVGRSWHPPDAGLPWLLRASPSATLDEK